MIGYPVFASEHGRFWLPAKISIRKEVAPVDAKVSWTVRRVYDIIYELECLLEVQEDGVKPHGIASGELPAWQFPGCLTEGR
jgi:hypothetical protein